MQAAARACLQEIATHFRGNLNGKKAQILCGPGNNGGDGAALAQDLSRLGVRTDVVLFGAVDATKGDARVNFELAQRLAAGASEPNDGSLPLSFVECKSAAEWNELAGQHHQYDLIVDALFGTGLTRPLEGVFLEVVQHLVSIRRVRDQSTAMRPWIFSVDVPSGLNADSAKLIGPTVEADSTVTFTSAKPANVLPPAAHLNGKLVVADIGSPPELIEEVNSSLYLIDEQDARNWLISTRYTPESFKNTHGHVLVIAGSRGYTGAAVLCGNAAMRSGAGLVTIATPASAQATVAATSIPEVMTTALAETDSGAVSDLAIDHVKQLTSKATVIAIGPGLTAEDELTRRFVYEVIRQRWTPVVIDADALNCLSPWPRDLEGHARAPLILTPHLGEMLRLLGAGDKSRLDDRVAVVRDFAAKHNVIMVLKGSRSLIGTPDRVFINPTGNAGLGTAGAGDTLTGIIAGFVAQSFATLKDEADALTATIAAVYLGGLAGDFAARNLGMRSMVASDIREHLNEAIRSIDAEGELP